MDSTIFAIKEPPPKAMAFEGAWSSAQGTHTLRGAQLTWASGVVSFVKRMGGDVIAVYVDGLGTFHATLQRDGHALHWGNGAVWTRLAGMPGVAKLLYPAGSATSAVGHFRQTAGAAKGATNMGRASFAQRRPSSAQQLSGITEPTTHGAQGHCSRPSHAQGAKDSGRCSSDQRQPPSAQELWPNSVTGVGLLAAAKHLARPKSATPMSHDVDSTPEAAPNLVVGGLVQARPSTSVIKRNVEHCQPFDFGTITRVDLGNNVTIHWERTAVRTVFTRDDLLLLTKHIVSGNKNDGLPTPIAPNSRLPSSPASSPNHHRRHRPASGVATYSSVCPDSAASHLFLSVAKPPSPAPPPKPWPVPRPNGMSADFSKQPPRLDLDEASDEAIQKESKVAPGHQVTEEVPEETPAATSHVHLDDEGGPDAGHLGAKADQSTEPPAIGELDLKAGVQSRLHLDSVAGDPQLPPVTCRAYGVLGKQWPSLEQRGPMPGPLTAVVDPIDVLLLHDQLSRARDASQAIYTWCCIETEQSLPVSVQQALCTTPLAAKHHDYSDCHVIHTAVPELSKADPENMDDLSSWFVRRLALAYTNVLREFAASGLSELRLLPLGGHACSRGSASPKVSPLFAAITVRALRRGFANLDRPSRCDLWANGRAIEMCVYVEGQHDEYRRAFEEYWDLAQEETQEIEAKRDGGDDLLSIVPPLLDGYSNNIASAVATVQVEEIAAKLECPLAGRRRRRISRLSVSRSPSPSFAADEEELMGRRRKPENHPLTTDKELWEILVGKESTKLEVREFVDISNRARTTGLSTSMRVVVPMRGFAGSTQLAEEISLGEVEQLCLLVIEDAEVTEAHARQNLEIIKEVCRKDEYDIWSCSSAVLSFPRLKKVLSLISSIMLIDREYVISHYAWCVTGRFEMTDTLAALVAHSAQKQYQHCMRGSTGSDAVIIASSAALRDAFAAVGMSALEHSIPDTAVLKEPFRARDFQVLAYNSGMIARDGRAGISYGEMVTMYHRVWSRMSQLKEAHAATRMPACSRSRCSQLLRNDPQLFDSHGSRDRSPLRGAAGARSLSPRPSVAEDRRGSGARSLSPRPSVAEDRRGSNQAGLLGRTELEILFEELWRTGSMSREYRSPLKMVLCLLGRADTNKSGTSSDP